MTAMTRPSWALVGGPLAPYAGGFRGELERLGYTPLTAATHMRLMAHLSRWLAREGMAAAGVDPGGGGGVLRRTPVGRLCRAASPAGRCGRCWDTCGGWVWFRLLRRPTVDVEERLLARYREYLLRERGLSRATAELNVRMVRPFLAGRAAEGDGA